MGTGLHNLRLWEGCVQISARAQCCINRPGTGIFLMGGGADVAQLP